MKLVELLYAVNEDFQTHFPDRPFIEEILSNLSQQSLDSAITDILNTSLESVDPDTITMQENLSDNAHKGQTRINDCNDDSSNLGILNAIHVSNLADLEASKDSNDIAFIDNVINLTTVESDIIEDEYPTDTNITSNISIGNIYYSFDTI